MIRLRFRSAEPDDARRPDEPRTVPEAQRWLHVEGFNECTEGHARALLDMRRLVREGGYRDDR